MAKTDLTAQRLRELLDYDPETGVFRWRDRRSPVAQAGSVAGSDTRDGYRKIIVDGRSYLAHRLAWLYVTGVWPVAEIDHKFGEKRDNRFCMLREANRSFNQQNERRARRNSRNGLTGARFDPRANRWQAVITLNRVRHHLGMYATGELAHAAYLAAKRKMHPGCTV